jgi:hypothetical protein
LSGSQFPAKSGTESGIYPHRIASGIFERRDRSFHQLTLMVSQKVVTPVKTGGQTLCN